MMILTPAQGEALVAVAVTLRPEWHSPGVRSILQRAGELPAVNYLHALRAMIAYAVEVRPQDGRPVRTTPAHYPAPGGHWEATRPSALPAPSSGPAPRCQDHDTEPAVSCRSCWGDVRVGMRPAAMVGKALQRATTAPRTRETPAQAPGDLHHENGRQNGAQALQAEGAGA